MSGSGDAASTRSASHPERRRADLRAALLEDGDLLLLSVGRVSEEKRLGILLEAFAALRKRVPGARLAVVGDGPARRRLEVDAPPGVRFLGELRDDALADVYATADVFCFPSTTDTFGQVILEAAASGLPAVAAGAGGGLELVRSGETGLVVPPDDPTAFMHALLELAENENLRLALAGRALAAARSRSWAQADDELVAGYAAAIDGHLQDLAEPRPALARR